MSYNTSPSCSYSTLQSYNGKSMQGARPPVPATSVSGIQVIPLYGGIGYDTLTSDEQSCSGYRNIMTAYNRDGMNAASCNQQYGTRTCM